MSSGLMVLSTTKIIWGFQSHLCLLFSSILLQIKRSFSSQIWCATYQFIGGYWFADNLGWLIFYWPKAARKLREKVIFDGAKTIEDVRQVMKSYYLVLVNQVRTDLVKSNIATLNSTLRNTKELYENGFAEGIDVSRLGTNE